MTGSERVQGGGSRCRATEPIAQPAPLSPGGSRSCATAATETGGSQCPATLDARQRVPPAMDTRQRVPPATDAQQRVPPARRHPSHNSVMTFHDNRSILLFVTIVTEKRMPVLVDVDAQQRVPPGEDEREGRAAARPRTAVDCILAAWADAADWLVGRYIIMPDHIHFFCAPASYPSSNFHRWMAYWKFLATREYWRMMRGALGGSQCSATLDARQRVPPATDAQQRVPPAMDAQQRVPPAMDARQRVPPVRNPPLFQRDCWDRQLRTGESYAQKWEYVRNNPVRKGLVAAADDWPYQGELNVLVWHEGS